MPAHSGNIAHIRGCKIATMVKSIHKAQLNCQKVLLVSYSVEITSCIPGGKATMAASSPTPISIFSFLQAGIDYFTNNSLLAKIRNSPRTIAHTCLYDDSK